MKKLGRIHLLPKAERLRRAERGTARRCPKCGCTKVATADVSAKDQLRMGIEQAYGPRLSSCSACKTLWEPLPDGCHLDDDGSAFALSEPCDNCAFRKGSPEQQSHEKWQETLQGLRSGGKFYCHKGVPIESGSKHGFAYPTLTDGVLNQKKARLCRGFLNAWGVWIKREFAIQDLP